MITTTIQLRPRECDASPAHTAAPGCTALRPAPAPLPWGGRFFTSHPLPEGPNGG
jgi:hypothetical protein